MFFFCCILFTANSNAQIKSYSLIENKVVTVPDALPIGEVSFLDSFQDKLVLTDQTIGNVLFFNGEKWALLDPQECYPGFRFFPIESHFEVNGDIFISNSGIWGFRFENDGTCVGSAHKEFRAPQRFHTSNRIVGLSNNLENSIVTYWENSGKFIDTLFTIENEFKSAEYRLNIGGIVESNNFIYAINGLTPTLYKYNLNNSNLTKKSFKDIDYIKPSRDLPKDARSIEFMKQAQPFMKKYSMNYNLYDLNSSQILLVVRKFNKSKYHYYCYIFDKNSLELSGKFIVENRVVYAGNNTLVFVFRETLNDYETDTVHLIFNDIDL